MNADILIDQQTYARHFLNKQKIEAPSLVNVRDKLMGGMQNIASLTPGTYNLWVGQNMVGHIVVNSSSDIIILIDGPIPPQPMATKVEAPKPKPILASPMPIIPKPQQAPSNSSPEATSTKPQVQAIPKVEAPKIKDAPKPAPKADLPKGVCFKCRIKPQVKAAIPEGIKWREAGSGKCSVCHKQKDKLWSILG